MKKLLFLLPVLVALGACRPATDTGEAGPPDSGNVVSVHPELAGSDLQQILAEYVNYLASDALAGREVGSQGINRAEQYIADTFAALGLSSVPGQEDYFLEFTLYRGGYDPDATSLSVRTDGTSLNARPGVDFQPFSFSKLGELSAELVFAGYGITAPEYGYDDYTGLDAEGKIVLLLRHEPQSPSGSDYFLGADLTRHSLFLTKVENARAHDAAGMLLVTDPKSYAGPEDLRLQEVLGLQPSALSRYPGVRQSIPALHISQDFAEKILGTSSAYLERLQERLDEGTDPSLFDIGHIEVSLNVAVQQRSEEIQARNVAAFLEGSDPLLRDEWILVGAHHDHLGSYPGEGDTIFNGADDNASGVAGVLALARILAERKSAPARSLVFATFSAEEQGLFGSREMIEGQIPIEQIVLMINLDMVGRNPERPVQIMGSSFSPDLQKLVEEANQAVGLPVRYSSGPEAAVSDHDPFFREGIPFLFFFTGIHPDYHGTADHADKLSYPRFADVVVLAAKTATLAADRPTRGSTIYVEWLGLTLSIEDEQDAVTAEITEVEAGTAAVEYGLLEGDKLLALGGVVPEGSRDIRRNLEAVRPGRSLTLKVLRGELEREIQVQRAHTGYLGVMVGELDEQWRKQNDLEAKSGVLIRQVLEDGPAGKAGLNQGDVLLALNGIAVGPENLRALLMRLGAGARVELTVLRKGERLIVPLILGRRP
ncbi:MAG: M20/M25/M40 family metallo-hydrolase [Spirochaetaceae bacterium]|nr:MAG: M20/M25/M40 family metallo-hydrolase [Spirochaetaceae bacterium]